MISPVIVREESITDAANLVRYGTLSIAFPVRSQLAVYPVDGGLGGLLLVEKPVNEPYVKDYDVFESERPIRWSKQFDTSRWGMFFAYKNDLLIGGAVVAWDTPGVDMLEDRQELAMLWDLRVHPDHRGGGVGYQLFQAAEKWAESRGCVELKIETQNINVAACRFYARQGCVLRTIRHNAYPDLPNELQLLWYKALSKQEDTKGSLW